MAPFLWRWLFRIIQILDQSFTLEDNKENPLLRCIQNNIIGNKVAFIGPYGVRQGNTFQYVTAVQFHQLELFVVVYCDYVASGKLV